MNKYDNINIMIWELIGKIKSWIMCPLLVRIYKKVDDVSKF